MKVAILCPGKMGDVVESTGLFRHALELWGPRHDIHWYLQEKYAQPLEHNPMVTPHYVPAGRAGLKQALGEIKAGGYDAVYHTVAWLNMEHVWKVPLPLIPPRVLGVKLNSRTWTPQIWLTPEEEAGVAELVAQWPKGVRIMLETECFSHQGAWTDDMTKELIERTSSFRPVFVTASFGYAPKMWEWGAKWIAGLDNLNYRQIALAYNHCDMYLGVPSGAASVTCANVCRTLPRIEYLAENRCPRGGKTYPDWGTGAMRPCSAFCDAEKVLDKAVEVVQNISGAGNRTRLERKADQRRSRRRGSHMRQGDRSRASWL